jgi:hypothetical protein
VNNEVLGFIAHVADITNIKKVELSILNWKKSSKKSAAIDPDVHSGG